MSPLPEALSAPAVLREVLETYVADLAPIRDGLADVMATSDPADVYAPIWASLGSAELAALTRAFAAVIERNNARLLEELGRR
ncbi:MAG: hypothetical protein VKP57_06495 [Candidatus Sericytochromatia bacterium]|jgi:hypothetical protein|nr:hypothetical protein [Candidatus Sericytochromatia bacterium]